MAVLVTGANGGVGSAIVRHLLARTDHDVLHVHEHTDVAEELASEYPERTRIVRAELCDEDAVERLAKELAGDGVVVDALVNNAGVTSNGLSWKLEVGEFERIVRGNLLPTFLCTKHFLPEMRRRERGRILNISSVVGEVGAVGASHYGAAKAGIVGFTRSVAKEVATKGVTVNALALGYTLVGIIETIPRDILEKIVASIPVARLAEPEEIGSTVAWLISDEASYLTGHVVHLSGGL
jgi:3-oxoacyl-[acyl-carrier protein] reductase